MLPPVTSSRRDGRTRTGQNTSSSCIASSSLSPSFLQSSQCSRRERCGERSESRKGLLSGLVRRGEMSLADRYYLQEKLAGYRRSVVNSFGVHCTLLSSSLTVARASLLSPPLATFSLPKLLLKASSETFVKPFSTNHRIPAESKPDDSIRVGGISERNFLIWDLTEERSCGCVFGRPSETRTKSLELQLQHPNTDIMQYELIKPNTNL